MRLFCLCSSAESPEEGAAAASAQRHRDCDGQLDQHGHQIPPADPVQVRTSATSDLSHGRHCNRLWMPHVVV